MADDENKNPTKLVLAEVNDKNQVTVFNIPGVNEACRNGSSESGSGSGSSESGSGSSGDESGNG